MLADYETPRTSAEMDRWWLERYEEFSATREGRVFAREGKGLSKKFHDEAQPMLAYMKLVPPDIRIRCRLAAGTDKADCTFLDAGGKLVRQFQITTAVDGRTEVLRRRQLSRIGHVDGLSKLNEEDEISDDAPASDHDAPIVEMAGYIRQCMAAKSAKGYGAGFSLIVEFEDSTYSLKGDLEKFRHSVGEPEHTFTEAHVIGIHGNIHFPLPPSRVTPYSDNASAI